VSIRTRSRDGVVTIASSWAAWRGLIRSILTRPCPVCDGEGMVFWCVDTWHAEQCKKCKGNGTVIIGRNF
jgi:DnaJ-class molecular chaperone